jgi:hypothetical protein
MSMSITNKRFKVVAANLVVMTDVQLVSDYHSLIASSPDVNSGGMWRFHCLFCLVYQVNWQWHRQFWVSGGCNQT